MRRSKNGWITDDDSGLDNGPATAEWKDQFNWWLKVKVNFNLKLTGPEDEDAGPGIWNWTCTCLLEWTITMD